MGEYDRAIEDFTEALSIKPDAVGVLSNRAYAWVRKGENDRAVEDFTAALRIKPDNVFALFDRGQALRQMGELERAVEDYTAALRIDPNNFRAFYYRGAVLSEMGEYGRGIEDFTAALRINPNYAEALHGLAFSLATVPEAGMRDGGTAVRLAEKGVSLRNTASKRAVLAAAYAEAGRFDDAIDAQERAVAKARAEEWSAEEISDLEDGLRLYREGRPFRIAQHNAIAAAPSSNH